MNPIFKGTCTALATPMNADGIDSKSLTKLVDWQIQEGVQALVACGTTGEPSTMTEKEWAKTVETVIATADNRVPVIAGTGGNNTAHVIALAKLARKMGAAAQLCVTPYYNKTTQQGLIAHYTAIADAGDLPVIIYNVPSRTGLNMWPDTLAQLSSHQQIIAMKEASADLTQVADMMRLCEGRIDFYSGSDEVIVPLMSLGGLGVVSVVSNIAPRLTSTLTSLMLEGKMKEAAQMQLSLMPLIHALFCEVNPIPVKAGLHMLGMCDNLLRLPLIPMSEKNEAVLKALMQKTGLIP